MNALGILLVWTALQVTLFCGFGALVYALARRRNPAAGAWAAGVALVMVLVMSLAAFSPWPLWWSLSQGYSFAPTRTEASPAQATREKPSDAIDEEQAEAADADATAPLNDDSPASSIGRIWPALVFNVRAGVEQMATEMQAPRWRWPAWWAAVGIGGMVCGLVRLVGGLAAVEKLRRDTRAVNDGPMLDLLCELRVRLNCRAEIELREASPHCTFGSAAAVGWLRPLVVLPGDWRDWNDTARRAVLAHEVAHIARNDFALGLLAQLGLALHFYNPFVHWLAARLRLEQEMAADMIGAAAAGGRRSYLEILARMALAQPRTKTLWAGRPFLPSRGTLMRRIEMLHRQRNERTNLFSSQARRAGLLVLLAATGLAIAGLRGPAARALAESGAEEPSPTPAATDNPPAAKSNFDLSHVPADASAALSLRPAELAKSPLFAEFFKGIDETVKTLGIDLSLAEIEEFYFVPICKLNTLPPERALANGQRHNFTVGLRTLAIRTSKPQDWQKLLLSFAKAAYPAGSETDGVTETEFNGQKYFRVGKGIGLNYAVLDDRTCLVSVSGQEMERLLTCDPKDRPGWYDRWHAMRDSALVLADIPHEHLGKEPMAEYVPAELTSFIQKTDLLLGKVDCTADGLKIHATADCAPDAAKEMGQLSQVLLTLARQALAQDTSETLRPLYDQLCDSMRLTSLPGGVQLDATFANSLLVKIIKASQEQQARRAEERKKASVKKIGDLLTALNKYRATHGQFPSSSVLGPDGKTPHSWRVALLPFLGEQALYDEYHLDEPFDSKHNKSLMNRMPAAFLAASPVSGIASDYEIIRDARAKDWNAKHNDSKPTKVWKVNFEKPTGFVTTESIIVVDSQPSLPWTKPTDDIAGSARTKLLELHKIKGQSFAVGLTDGSLTLTAADINVEGSSLSEVCGKTPGHVVEARKLRSQERRIKSLNKTP